MLSAERLNVEPQKGTMGSALSRSAPEGCAMNESQAAELKRVDRFHQLLKYLREAQEARAGQAPTVRGKRVVITLDDE